MNFWGFVSNMCLGLLLLVLDSFFVWGLALEQRCKENRPLIWSGSGICRYQSFYGAWCIAQSQTHCCFQFHIPSIGSSWLKWGNTWEQGFVLPHTHLGQVLPVFELVQVCSMRKPEIFDARDILSQVLVLLTLLVFSFGILGSSMAF